MKTQVLEKKYDFKAIEDRWFNYWMEKGYFKPSLDNRPKYCVTIPPPNVTGSLHMGHALNGTIQDILVRFHRMKGYDTVWFIGTDHAGIATQTVVEKHLLKQGIKRQDLSREEFLEKIWEWKEKYGNIILDQFKKLGISGYFDYPRFTMDPDYTKAVRKAFKHLYDKGWVYKGKRVVNWCPRCLTSLSDLEVEFKETKGKLWYIRYPGYDFDGEIVIATTRPETMLADTAVAVNPKDERYKHLIGKHVKLPLVGRILPIIADEAVDPEFGTGALKVTPGHDFNDFEIGQRHNLQVINIFTPEAKLNDNVPERYRGLDRYEARELVLRDLKEQGYLVKEEDYDLVLGTCYRCGTPLEPYLSDQWFIKMSDLAKPAIEVVERDEIRFFPQKFKEVYLNWMYNLRDWCVSRQLVWGHRIPIYTCQDCGHQFSSEEEPTSCPKCGSKRITQEEDVLDTWFSSALWPFAVQGWPVTDKYLRKYYPTDILVTAREILFLWVARMIMMSLEFMGTIPFRDVIIHAVILHPSGKRMSKSLGTGIDPLELIEKYGADATRLGLIIQVATSQDIKFSYEKIEMARNFINKLWNSARFIQLKDPENRVKPLEGTEDLDLDDLDRWILRELARTIKEVSKYIEEYKLYEAAMKLYEFTWNEFCDWYLEAAKHHPEGIESKLPILKRVLKDILKLLHPFSPFVTEHLWQVMGFTDEKESITIAQWPETLEVPEPEVDLELLMDLVRNARTLKHESGLPSAKPRLLIETAHEELMRYKWFVDSMAKVESHLIKKGDSIPPSFSYASSGYTLYLPLEGVDLDKEIKRLEKEISDVERRAENTRNRLKDENFLKKAPEHVVEKFKRNLADMEEKLKKLRERLEVLKGLKG